MLRVLLLLVAVAVAVAGVVAAAVAENNGPRHGFYRDPVAAGTRRSGTGWRRMFGGRSASLQEWGAACALLDRFWTTRCSASALAARWVLTAAHCISPEIAFVKYNARRSDAPQGNVAAVHYLYRHPGYKVVQEDEGQGMDVTLLHHDVGLVHTSDDMRIAAIVQRPSPLDAMKLYDSVDIWNKEVQVLGFGRTEAAPLGEELFSARLRLVGCDRGAWIDCMCGVPTDAAVGVCAGDSGGPVVYRGAQVGVTSMGPLECSAWNSSAPEVGTSVFTALARYTALINATMLDSGGAQRMDRVSTAPERARPSTTMRLLAPLLIIVCATNGIL